jgi:hypothetical protein
MILIVISGAVFFFFFSENLTVLWQGFCVFLSAAHSGWWSFAKAMLYQ